MKIKIYLPLKHQDTLLRPLNYARQADAGFRQRRIKIDAGYSLRTEGG